MGSRWPPWAAGEYYIHSDVAKLLHAKCFVLHNIYVMWISQIFYNGKGPRTYLVTLVQELSKAFSTLTILAIHGVMATELYKEEDSQVYNIGVWKLLLNSLILSYIGICPDSVNRLVRNFWSRGGMGRSRGRNRLLFNNSNIAQNVLNCEKVGGASDKSRRGFRPPPPLADNPASNSKFSYTLSISLLAGDIRQVTHTHTDNIQIFVSLRLWASPCETAIDTYLCESHNYPSNRCDNTGQLSLSWND